MPTAQDLSMQLAALRQAVQSSPERLTQETEAVVQLAREIGESAQLKSALLLRAIGRRMAGQYNDAYRDFLEALDLAIKDKDTESILGLSAQLGDLLYDLTDYRHADRLLRTVLESPSLTHTNIRLLALLSGGNSLMKLNELSRSMEYLSEALNISSEIGEVRSINWSLHLIGLVSLLNGHPQEARFRFEQCLRFYHETNQIPNIAAAYVSIAESYMNEGNFDAATSTLNKALEIAKRGNLSTIIIDGYQHKARTALALGHQEAGRKALAQAHAEALKGDSSSDLIQIYAAFRELFEMIDDRQSSLKYRKLELELIERYERESTGREADIDRIIQAIP
jgi:tetratricopeptide (TPR) repeat protein